MIDKISFGSTYRIPITQAGVNSAKKAKLKELVESYPNGLCGKSKTGHARVSIANSEDANFIQKLKRIGYKVYQKFEGENIDKEEIDRHIKNLLDNRDFSQKGKSPKRMSTALKNKRDFDRNFTPKTQEDKFENFVEEIVAIPEEASVPKKIELPNRNNEPKVKYHDPFAETDRPKRNTEPKLRKPRLYYEPDEAKRAAIRLTEDYKKTVEEDGVEFAEAVFFGIIKD